MLLLYFNKIILHYLFNVHNARNVGFRFTRLLPVEVWIFGIFEPFARFLKRFFEKLFFFRNFINFQSVDFHLNSY